VLLDADVVTFRGCCTEPARAMFWLVYAAVRALANPMTGPVSASMKASMPRGLPDFEQLIWQTSKNNVQVGGLYSHFNRR
jgi:hypothetical protein